MRRKRITILGAFTILALGGLTFAGMALRFKPLGASTKWTVYFAEDSAIDKGARVYTSGFKVGFVSKVELVPLEEIFVVKPLRVEGLAGDATDDGKEVFMTRTGTYALQDPRYGKAIGKIATKGERGEGTVAVRLNGRYIRATLAVEPEVTLWEGARVTLARGTILGRHSVNLLRGTPRHGAELTAGPDQPLFGEVEAGVAEQLKQFVASNENEVRETIANINKFFEPLSRVSDTYKDKEGMLGHMLLEKEQYDDLSEALASLAGLGDDFKELREFVRSLRSDYEEGQGLLQALVKDGQVRKDFEAILARFEKMSASLESAESGGILAALIHDKEERERFSNSLIKLDEGITDLRKAAAQLNDTKGTLGMLLNDEGTRQELREFVKQITKVGNQLSSVEGSTLGRLINDDRIVRDLEAMVSEFREAGQVARENAPLGSLTSFTILFFDVLN